ncbi:MAG: FAD-dependent oxidoreductase [Actinomycetota bacterium]
MAAQHRVAVVGAGLAGLTAATTLLDHEAVDADDVIVLEAEAEVGGRLATETLGTTTFDHGAQFFTVRTERFGTRVEQWLGEGSAEVWTRGFGSIDGYPRYRGVGGMRTLARSMAEALTERGVILRCAAAVSLAADETGWRLRWPPGELPSRGGETTADAVLLTPPVPESLELLAPLRGATTGNGLHLDPGALDELDALRCHRVIALLVTLGDDPGLPAPGALQQPSDPIFSFVADNRAKGISERPGLTLHTAHERSAELWALSDAEVIDRLRPAVEHYAGGAAIESVAVRRWPHSGPVKPIGATYLEVADRPGPLLMAGDAFGGSKVEGAFTSGAEAGDRLAQLLS